MVVDTAFLRRFTMKKIINAILCTALAMSLFVGCSAETQIENKKDDIIQWKNAVFKSLVYDEMEIEKETETKPIDFEDIKTLVIISDEKLIINPDLSKFDMETLKENFDLEDFSKENFRMGHITNLDDLANFINLEKLVIFADDLENINFVSKLSNLNSLAIIGCDVSDITPLIKCDNLENLFLDANEIEDISVFNKFDKLPSKLSLYGNEIADISPLKSRNSQTTLEYLNLSGNEIEDISALSGYTQINTLLLISNEIEDDSPVANLTDSTVILIDNPCFKGYSPEEIGQAIGGFIGQFVSGIEKGFLDGYNK